MPFYSKIKGLLNGWCPKVCACDLACCIKYSSKRDYLKNNNSLFQILLFNII